MANQRLKTQHIRPEDFNITWGDDPRYWRLPTPSEPTAILIKVCYLAIEAKANLDIDPCNKNRVKISFEVFGNGGISGFKNADVRIGAKIGAGGHYHFKPVSLADLGQFEYKTVHAEFDLEPNPCASDITLHFGLFDIWTPHWKESARFHGACVSLK